MTPEQHCDLKIPITLDRMRSLWADLPDKHRMEVLKSVIWTAPDMHAFYAKAMAVLNDPAFAESLD